MNDPALIQRLLAGDEAAFRAVVTEFQRPMLAVARAIVGPAFAEEIVQESWLAVLNNLRNFEGRASLKTWVLQIV
ncbi:MAG: RNA polymerase sigma factor, partial [Gammaproteobacteria bacterium]|nr:RNA polymerase sigma factor [Gammaproteobacteria bacterium]